MSKRLEEIKRETKPKAKMVDPPIYYREIKEVDYQYLIEQAKQIESHAPEGRNYTNAQYVELLHERNNYREALEFILSYDFLELTVPHEIIVMVKETLEDNGGGSDD